MPYVIGIDGGGTKTSCAIQYIELDGRVVSRERGITFFGEATNPQSVGWDTMICRLKDLISQAIQASDILPGEIIGICAGIAGARLEADRIRIEQSLQQIAGELKLSKEAVYSVTTDLYIALRGMLDSKQSQGILVIAGTGSNAIGLSDGVLYKSGGWGHVLGDEGSGYAIGLEALRAVCRAYDYREAPTELSHMVLKALKISGESELISYMYPALPPKNEIASIAKLVIEASHRSDQTAIRILQKAADDLAELVRSLFLKSREFDVHTPVFVTGSVFVHSELLRERFAQHLKKEGLGHVQLSRGDSLDGALTVARELLYQNS
ncbi:N-acetylglucosamine kinase [Paenibacillus sp. Soil787]|uniref:N-acetylglucosamine kinase n=1 Tax=Paenibacillus sp. Soil787 TaxID=1736411 RepID=UPI0006F9AEA5|nr:BadF/BadG/BcrA/BcrD ATPase family protein [Paenibacillus sp. Soil787]KRF42948.1 hypothetical protein ASG93_20550 [Paenibacillus sp. Soil787]